MSLDTLSEQLKKAPEIIGDLQQIKLRHLAAGISTSLHEIGQNRAERANPILVINDALLVQISTSIRTRIKLMAEVLEIKD